MHALLRFHDSIFFCRLTLPSLPTGLRIISLYCHTWAKKSKSCSKSCSFTIHKCATFGVGALSWSGWLGTMGGKACFISRVFYSLKHFSKFENFVCFSVLSYAQNIDLLENKIDGVHRGVQNIGWMLRKLLGEQACLWKKKSMQYSSTVNV